MPEYMAQDFRDITELAKYLANGSYQVVGIEGFCGAGKSKLADELGKLLRTLNIETDDFVNLRDGNYYYVDRLDLQRLKILIEDKIVTKNTIIVNGICLRDVMARIQLNLDCWIYVKRLNRPAIDNPLWYDGIDLDQLEENPDRIQEYEEPNRSAYLYHIAKKPHECADIIFERFEYS